MTNTSTRNWDAIGIRWDDSKDVHRQAGDHATDRISLGAGQVPQLYDLDVFMSSVSNARELILGGMNGGQSWRVAAQDVSRSAYETGTKDAETIRERVWNRIQGIRATGGGSTKRYALPGGTFWTGSDLVEYRDAYFEALVAASPDIPKALANQIVGTLTL